MLNKIVHKIHFPILSSSFSFVQGNTFNLKKIHFPFSSKVNQQNLPSTCQDLDLYWEPEMAEMLETWGEGNAWSEIQFFIVNCQGMVLDIACGTGKTIELLSKFSNVEIHGCDISDFLIEKAIARGIPKECLKVSDATKTGYDNNFFNYAYSIGSLEHFTEDGILQFISEVYRITNFNSFHMIPVSRSEKNEGWMKTVQSFHNNSVGWWTEKFKVYYEDVYVIDSKWEDNISVGKWFICLKRG